ncbi:hypothetical protein KP509_30G018700 [Ceratopteris richardii]|uniref:Uncharacterized protein n=1 Tax=Ceratopteris richardii TaxID=49495 RepID=A0A8T2R2J9_CERRI|nr:hypothetical protein KP509_30G018700 [Ceratopteris richardii]
MRAKEDKSAAILGSIYGAFTITRASRCVCCCAHQLKFDMVTLGDTSKKPNRYLLLRDGLNLPYRQNRIRKKVQKCLKKIEFILLAARRIGTWMMDLVIRSAQQDCSTFQVRTRDKATVG